MSDTMLLGVLRMPFEIAMSTLTARIQYHQRGVQAADEIEKLTRERDEARAALKASSCAYPDCVDLGPDGKCTKWLLGKCDPTLDAKP